MENNIATMKSEKFGKVRLIFEGDKVLYCAADVAHALGYSNGRDAVARHCKGVLKRNTPICSVAKRDAPTSSSVKELSYLTESDVYRLICHSKLPSALEFEKWVFEDVVPKAVNDNMNTEAEQLTLETSEYHYFPKTLNGVPVITIADFSYFTGVASGKIYKPLRKICKLGEEYFSLSSAGIAHYKRENPNVSRLQSVALVLKESAVRKLLKYFDLSVDIPMIEEKKALPTTEAEPVTANRKPKYVTTDDAIVALEVLRYVKEHNESYKRYDQVAAIEKVIKDVGMLIAAGY